MHRPGCVEEGVWPSAVCVTTTTTTATLLKVTLGGEDEQEY